MAESVWHRIYAIEAAKGRLGAMLRIIENARRMICFAGVVCVLVLAGYYAERAEGQTAYPGLVPPTPPPPGQSYGQGGAYSGSSYRGGSYYPGGSPSSSGYPGGYSGTGSYDARYRNPSTGRYGATPTPDTGNLSSQYGQYGRTPRAGKTTPTPKGATPTPKGATPAPGQGPASTRNRGVTPVVIQGAMPAMPRPGAAVAKPAAGTASFSFKPAPDVAVLYITPLQAKIATDEEFETQVSLSNPGKKEFQTITVVLRFDPDILEPIRLDDDTVNPLFDKPSESVVYTQAGILIYEAKLAQPMTAQAADLFTIRWKTLAVSPHTDVGFAAWRGQRTALLNKSKTTVLGGAGNEGSLGMTLQTYSPAALADGPTIGDELFASQRPTTRGGVRLRLVANKEKIPANEDFYVGVWFENPRLLEISKVTLKIRFDPRILQVVDDDAKNWITTGINIFDGDYHDDFPFDVHVENSASNDIGLISYAVACTQRRSLPEHGYLVRIRFRPKALSASTPIEFALEPDDDPMRTQVSYLGESVLGSPERDDTGVDNLTVKIVEPQLPRLLATEK